MRMQMFFFSIFGHVNWNNKKKTCEYSDHRLFRPPGHLRPPNSHPPNSDPQLRPPTQTPNSDPSTQTLPI